jgi:toxin YhaV
MIVVKDWVLVAHPLFIDQLNALADAIERDRAKKPSTYRQSANAKLLAALFKLVVDVIPANPNEPAFRQGDTLGSGRKHWFRAKFGAGRFRLFFRFSSSSHTIIYAWVNDQHTLRTYGSKTDAYRVFSKMLDSGNPPDGWGELSKAAADPETARRLAGVIERAKSLT